MSKNRILVVDDEEVLCDVLRFNLEVEGYEVEVAYSAEEALQQPVSTFDLILLDVMMGTMSGFKMAQILKSDPKTADIPIIFCTAKDTENDTVIGLTIGADDYISKPFSIREVIARVKTVLRRTQKSVTNSATVQELDTISYQTLSIDTKKKLCSIESSIIPLTKKEFEVLTLMLQHQGIIFSREEILQRIWSDDVVVVDRTVDVTITRLRKKLGIYGPHIVTRHGYGYGFEA